eukprot:364303-Chlamydomonas_euryale.AAC.3
MPSDSAGAGCLCGLFENGDERQGGCGWRGRIDRSPCACSLRPSAAAPRRARLCDVDVAASPPRASHQRVAGRAAWRAAAVWLQGGSQPGEGGREGGGEKLQRRRGFRVGLPTQIHGHSSAHGREAFPPAYTRFSKPALRCWEPPLLPRTVSVALVFQMQPRSFFSAHVSVGTASHRGPRNCPVSPRNRAAASFPLALIGGVGASRR